MKKDSFPLALTTILFLFIGLMIIVSCVAYGRRTGNTGVDMVTIHQLRKIKA